jgi:hypothetical protein
MTKKEIRGLDDEKLLKTFEESYFRFGGTACQNDSKAATERRLFRECERIKDELLHRLQEGAESKKKLGKILALAKTIDPADTL